VKPVEGLTLSEQRRRRSVGKQLAIARETRTALQNLAIAFDQYNESHPDGAPKYRLATQVSPANKFSNLKSDRVSGHAGEYPVPSFQNLNRFGI